MKGKIIVALLFLFAWTTSCKGDEAVEPDGSAFAIAVANGYRLPFGKYNLETYEDNKQILYDVVLEVKNEKDEDDLYIINGQSTINFYFAKFETDFQKQSITIHAVGSTKIQGSLPEAVFEQEYLERLANVQGYRLNTDGDQLTLNLPDTKKMIFSLDKN